MPINPLIGLPPQSKAILANTVIVNDRAPFLAGQPAYVDSLAGTTLYGVNAPGNLSVTKYFTARATAAASQFGVEMPSTVNAPQNTTGGALAAANQLRVVALTDGTIRLRLRGDQDPSAGTFAVGAGGGTMIGDATMVLNASTAAGLATYQIKSSGANVKTLIVGDRMTIVEGTLTETVTVTKLFTANGTTAVSVFTTPLVNSYTVAATLTFVAATGRAIVFGTALTANSDVEVWIMDAADVVTVGNTGGALTAGQVYDAVVADAMHTAGAVNLTKAVF
jgi:hypothetical protein